MKEKRYFHPVDKQFVKKEVYFDFMFGSDYLSSELKGSIREYKESLIQDNEL
jgi:hypothetical protein